jgi:hypothetical protein
MAEEIAQQNASGTGIPKKLRAYTGEALTEVVKLICKAPTRTQHPRKRLELA